MTRQAEHALGIVTRPLCDSQTKFAVSEKLQIDNQVNPGLKSEGITLSSRPLQSYVNGTGSGHFRLFGQKDKQEITLAPDSDPKSRNHT